MRTRVSFLECIANAVDEKKISPERAQAAKETFEQLEADFRGDGHGERAAADRAAKATFEQLEADAIHKRRVLRLQALTSQRVFNNIARYRTRRNDGRPGAGASAHINNDHNSQFPDLHYRQRAIANAAFSQIHKILRRNSPGMFGQIRNKAEILDLVRAAFGEKGVSVAAREMAESWGRAAERLRLRANEAGMRIPSLEGWGLPQIHDHDKITSVGFDKWRAALIQNDWLDWDQMIDYRTGQRLSVAERETALLHAYENIRMDGLGGDPTRRRALHNRRSDHRFFKFRNADAWFEYQQAFGNPNSYEVMITHIQSMSKDIAELEIFGPNPTATRSAMRAFAEKRAKALDQKFGGNKYTDEVASDLDTFDELYLNWRYGVRIGSRRMKAFWGTTRNLITSSFLGSAPITAISDIWTARMTASLLGMSATKVMMRYVREMAGTRHRTEMAARALMPAMSLLEVNTNVLRLFGESSGPEWSRRVADSALKFYGLNRVTEKMRQAFGFEFYSFISGMSDKKFSQLPKGLQEGFARYGINKAGWDAIRGTEKVDIGGGKWILPDQIKDEELASQLTAMLLREIDQAVPTTSGRAKHILTGRVRQGTIVGDLVNNAALFKSWPVTIVVENLARFASLPGSNSRRAWVIAEYLIGGAIIGGLVLQLKALKDGKDPRDMRDPKFWMAGSMQAGGLGIISDFLFADVNRFGGSKGETLTGPVYGVADDILNLSFGNAADLAFGEEPNFKLDAFNFAVRMAPGTNAWYLKLGLERMVIDRMREMIDPRAHRRWRAKMKFHYRNYGQKFFWRPGDPTPHRMPNLKTAIGDK